MKNSGNVYNIDVCLTKKELATILFCGFNMTQQNFARNYFVQTITMNSESFSKPAERVNISVRHAKTKCFFVCNRFGVSMEKYTLRYRMIFISFECNKSQLSNKLVLRKVISDSFVYFTNIFKSGDLLLNT